MSSDINSVKPLLIYQNINNPNNFNNAVGKLLLIDTSYNNLLAVYRCFTNGDKSHSLIETQNSSPSYHVLTHSTDYSIESLGIKNNYFKVGSSMFDGYHGISNSKLSQSGWISFVYDTQWEEFSRKMEQFNEIEKLISVSLIVSYV